MLLSSITLIYIKVQLDYDEIEEGYEFTYLPWCSGDYRITIKYGGDYHIAGSPFLARIEGLLND